MNYLCQNYESNFIHVAHMHAEVVSWATYYCYKHEFLKIMFYMILLEATNLCLFMNCSSMQTVSLYGRQTYLL